eukprot:9971458-Prorocentrum_lima.AAC.1
MQEKDGPERCPEIKGFSIDDLKEECIRAGIPYQSAASMVTAAQLDITMADINTPPPLPSGAPIREQRPPGPPTALNPAYLSADDA